MVLVVWVVLVVPVVWVVLVPVVWVVLVLAAPVVLVVLVVLVAEAAPVPLEPRAAAGMGLGCCRRSFSRPNE